MKLEKGDKVQIRDVPSHSLLTPAWCSFWTGTVVRTNKKSVTVEFEIDEPGRKYLQQRVAYEDVILLEK